METTCSQTVQEVITARAADLIAAQVVAPERLLDRSGQREMLRQEHVDMMIAAMKERPDHDWHGYDEFADDITLEEGVIYVGFIGEVRRQWRLTAHHVQPNGPTWLSVSDVRGTELGQANADLGELTQTVSMLNALWDWAAAR